jgi:hypothetical protein
VVGEASTKRQDDRAAAVSQSEQASRVWCSSLTPPASWTPLRAGHPPAGHAWKVPLSPAAAAALGV